MKKILLSLGSIVFAGALLAGGTGAFLASSNTSTGNTFATGVIDLKVDNESYVTNAEGKLVFSSSTSWGLSNLAGKLFFNFLDLKPGDIGEDTISLHVKNNDAWACMSIKLTGTPENGQDEPEALVDPTGGVNDGELQNNLKFVFWADDGDNVFETGEKIFKEGWVKDIWNGGTWSLADSGVNIWGGDKPLKADKTYYIGKVWCFGGISKTPLSQDGKGKTGTNGPLVRGTGFLCEGNSVGNSVQSDGITADVSFYVQQSRSYKDFLCSDTGGDPGTPPTSTSTIFTDNFEDYKDQHTCDSGHNDANWDTDNGVRFTTQSDGHKRVAEFDAAHPGHYQVLISNSINLSGYHNVTLKYDRKLDDLNTPPSPLGNQKLKVEYSTNGGGSWNLLETVTGESGWTTKTFSLSPNADNKSNVKIRFTFTGDNGTNRAYLDNVVVTATSL